MVLIQPLSKAAAEISTSDSDQIDLDDEIASASPTLSLLISAQGQSSLVSSLFSCLTDRFGAFV